MEECTALLPSLETGGVLRRKIPPPPAKIFFSSSYAQKREKRFILYRSPPLLLSFRALPEHTLWNFLPLPPPLLLAGIVRGRKFEKGLPYTSIHTILSPSFPAVRVHIYCKLMCRQFNTTDATYIFAPRTRKLFFSGLLSACAHFFLVASASPHQRIARDFSSLHPLSHSPHP